MNTVRPASLLAGVLSPLVLMPLAAQGIRVNGPLLRQPEAAAEDVLAFRIDPDGTWAVFLADPSNDGRYELFSAPVDQSGAWRRLSHVDGTSNGPLRIGADRVVFQQGLPPDNRFGLHSAPLDGSSSEVELHPPFVQGGSVRSYEIDACGSRVVYLADAAVDEVVGLYGVPSDGGTPPLELATLVAGGDVTHFRLSPDCQTVVYRADAATNDVFELWAVPSAGGASPVRLSGTLVAGGDVSEFFELTSDGARVVYCADQAADETIELWSAPLDGGAAPVRLNGALVAGGDVGPSYEAPFRLSWNGQLAVYMADASTDEVVELWAVSVDGSTAPVRLGSPFVAGGDVVRLYPLPLDDERVVYLADLETKGVFELFSAPIGGGPSVRLNEPLASDRTVGDVALALDARHVVYTSDEAENDVFELWSVPIDRGSAPLRLNGPLHAAADVSGFRLGGLGGAGGRAVYRADAREDEVYELWSVPLDGSLAPQRLSGALGLHGDVVLGFEVTPDGARALYRADQKVDETFALWSVPINRSSAPIELSMPLDPAPIMDGVREFAWTSDGGRLLYVANEINDPIYGYDFPIGVYSASLATLPEDGRIPVSFLGRGGHPNSSPDGSWAAFVAGEPNCLGEPCQVTLRCAPSDGSLLPRLLMNSVGYIGPRAFTPDDSRLVYRYGVYWPSGYTFNGLYSVVTDGTQGPALLSVSGSDPFIGAFEIEQTGQHVVFREAHDGRDHLYSAPIDGATPPLELNQPFPPLGQGLRSFRLSGAWVVFLGDTVTPGADEFYLTPIDGSAEPVRLGPPGSIGRDVEADFRISPDGEYVVYVVERELWSVPLDVLYGEEVRLSAAASGGGGIAAPLDERSQFEIAPDGMQVVYLARQYALAPLELYSAPIDGSLAPVRLHAPLVSGQSVELNGFKVDAASTWVVFVANLDEPSVRSLYRVPIGGGAQPLELSGPFVPGGEVYLYGPGRTRAAFEISAEGTWVAYLADQLTDDTVELFAAPIDGSRAARRLNRALVAQGNVREFAFAPVGTRVAYLADQETDEVTELFLGDTDPSHLRRAALRPGR